MLAAHAALLSFPGYLQCARPMDHGGPWIMGLPVGTSTRRMTWRRGSSVVACGSSYVPGETLSLSMPTTGGQYMVEVSGGGSIAGGTTCSSTRSRRSSFTFPFYVTMPLYGLVEAWAGHASGYSQVMLTPRCSLSGPTAPPPQPSPPRVPNVFNVIARPPPPASTPMPTCDRAGFSGDCASLGSPLFLYCSTRNAHAFCSECGSCVDASTNPRSPPFPPSPRHLHPRAQGTRPTDDGTHCLTHELRQP